jgi:thymidine kinase
MTPKKKAKDLVKKYLDIYDVEAIAIPMALIGIDEAIKFEKRIVKQIELLSDLAGREFKCEGLFWTEVKKEMETILTTWKKNSTQKP